MTAFVLTVIGEDRPGLVHRLATVVTENGGNWENSQLARLAGTFAGIVEIAVDSTQRERLLTSLDELGGVLDVTVRSAPDAAPVPAESLTLEFAGADHPGIVQDITAVLERGGATIERLVTSSSDAAMSGGRVFEARAVIRLASGAEIDGLERELEAIAGDLMIDVTLGGPPEE